LTVSNQLTYSGHKAVLPDGSVDIASACKGPGLAVPVVVAATHWTWRAGIDKPDRRPTGATRTTQTWARSTVMPPRRARRGRGSKLQF